MESGRFWAAVTAIATVAGVVVAFLAYRASTEQTPHEPATTTAVTDGAPPSGATSPAAPTPEGPLWQGSILLGERGIDFSVTPPELGTVNDISVNVSAYPASHKITGSSIARWTGPAAPTAAACAALLSTHSAADGLFDQGDTFCVDADTRVVKVTFVSQQGESWEVDATVWLAPR